MRIMEYDKQKPDVDHNARGLWVKLPDQQIRDAVARMAGRCHAIIAKNNPQMIVFRDFLDALAFYWREFRTKVEDEAQKYGFASCDDVSLIPPQNHPKIALLALTMNGSFVLLGNGCLTREGSFATYEKIPMRIGDGAARNRHVASGARCNGLPKVGAPMSVTNVVNTSPVYLLYSTTQQLPGGDAAHLAESLSKHYTIFASATVADFREVPQPNVPEQRPFAPVA